MQCLLGIGQRGLAMRTACRSGDHRLVGITGQRSTATLAAQTAAARATHFARRGVIGLLPLRWRQAGIVRRLRWLPELGFQLGEPLFGCGKALPEHQDQRVLLGIAQLAEVGQRGHPKLESSRP